VKRVFLGPSKIDGAVCRGVELEDGSGQVETWWPRKGWVPGGARWDEFIFAPPATAAFMQSVGMSDADIAVAGEPSASAEQPPSTPAPRLQDRPFADVVAATPALPTPLVQRLFGRTLLHTGWAFGDREMVIAGLAHLQRGWNEKMN
jgi:hypothetical protein